MAQHTTQDSARSIAQGGRESGEFHPVAEAWPLMSDSELDSLAADIKTNGLHYAIWRHPDGRIVDGRNRWIACRMAGVECQANTYRDGDGLALVEFVKSMNNQRRHMTESQRGMVAARLANLGIGANQHAEGRPDGLPSITNAEAAATMGVSEMTVKRARAVLRSDDEELIRQVDAGEVSVSKAVEQVRAKAGGKPRATSPKGPKKAEKKPSPAALLKLAHDADQQLVQQTCALLQRLCEVSEKIEPETLLSKTPQNLRHNYAQALPAASEFVRRLHLAWVAEKESAA